MGKVEENCLKTIKSIINKESFHGLSSSDIEEITDLVLSAIDNDNLNKKQNKGQTLFPDFISNNGFIEHFEVTSGKYSRRKGYDNIKRQKNIEKRNEQILEKHKELTTTSASLYRENESTKLFINSFKDIWKKHMNSFDNYDGLKHTSCFMIQSDDCFYTLMQPKNNYQIHNSINIGNYIHTDPNTPLFFISHNWELLDFLAQYADKIDYCIFLSGSYSLDIIKLKNIPFLKGILSNYKIIQTCTQTLQVCTTVRNPFYQGKK